MSKLPYILGGCVATAAVGYLAFAYRGTIANAFTRKEPTTGLPEGAKGGFFWQSPDGAPREVSSLAELETSVRSAYGVQAPQANVLLPGMTAWVPAAAAPGLRLRPIVDMPVASPPTATPPTPLAPGKYRMTKIDKPIASVMGTRNRWSGPGRDHLGNHR